MIGVVLTWLAVAAYVMPMGVNAAWSDHEHDAPVAASQEARHLDGCGEACFSEHFLVHIHANQIAMIGNQENASHTNKAADHATCCVAMCTPALPLIGVATHWPRGTWAASDRRVLTDVSPALPSRLERPPKAEIVSIG